MPPKVTLLLIGTSRALMVVFSHILEKDALFEQFLESSG
jgi:hypothetical protein